MLARTLGPSPALMGPALVAVLILAALTSQAPLTAAAAAACPATTSYGGDLPTTELDGHMMQLEWVGAADQVIFALSENGLLYRSGDYGETWSNETLRGKLRGLEAFSDESHDLYGRNGIAQIIFHKGRPDEVFFVGHGGRHWATFDKGASYVQPCGFQLPKDTCIAHPSAPGVSLLAPPSLKLHPTQRSWVLAMVRRDACFSVPTTDCADDLFFSKNFGQDWLNLTENSKGQVAGFVDYDWADGDDYVLATVFTQREHVQNRQYNMWDKNVDFVRSHDFFATVEKVLPCGNVFRTVKDRLFVAATRDCDKEQEDYASRNVQLYASADGGEHFNPVCFPVGIEDRGYSILEVSQDTAFIAVDHDEEDLMGASAPVGNLYTSDADMQLFGLAEKRVFRPHMFAVDFDRVKGIPATFLTNQLSEMAMSSPEILVGRASWDDFVQTRVSFNEGASWHPLTPPERDSAGLPYRCTTATSSAGAPCTLHLHGPSSWFKWGAARGGWFPSFYSHANAPGVVLAVGNVGEFLARDAAAVSTFISRDGGGSWEEIRSQPHIYELGDHGGIILIAEHASSSATDQLFFSRDEGRCWEGPIKLGLPLAIDNIRVEPDSKSHVFMVHGTVTNALGNQVTRLVTVDLKRILTEDEYPMCKDGVDYEYWTPTRDRCLLGRNFTMERRKQESRCFNGLDYEHRVVGELGHCDCAFDADVQCEYGYERNAENTACELVPHETFNATCPTLSGNRHWRDTGDRLVNADVCQNSKAVLQQGVHGRGRGGRGHGLGGVARLTLSLLAAGAAAAGLWFAWTRLGLRERVPDEWKDSLADFVEWLGEKMGSAKVWVETKLNLGTAGYGLTRADPDADDMFRPLADAAEAMHVDEHDAEEGQPEYFIQ